MYTPLRIDPTKALGDIATFQRKLAAGMSHLRGMREPEYANTPRELVWDPLESTCRHASLSIL